MKLGIHWALLSTSLPNTLLIENNLTNIEPVRIRTLGFVLLRMVKTSVRVLVDGKGIVLLYLKCTGDSQ